MHFAKRCATNPFGRLRSTGPDFKIQLVARLGRRWRKSAADGSRTVSTPKRRCRSAAQRWTRPGPTTGWRSSSVARAFRKASRFRGWIGDAAA